MAVSEVKAGDIWDEPGIFCSARKKGSVLKKTHSEDDKGT